MRYFPLLSLQASPQLGLIIFLMHASAFAAAIFSAAPWGLKMLCGLICFCRGYILLRRHAFLVADNAIIALGTQSGGDWELLDKKGKTHKAQLCGSSVVTHLGMMLNFICLEGRKKKTVLILPQTVGETVFRQSVVYLKTARSKNLLGDGSK